MNSVIARTIAKWREGWAFDRRKHDRGMTDDWAWEEYVDSLSVHEVLEALTWNDVTTPTEPTEDYDT